MGKSEAAQDLGGPRGRPVRADHLQPAVDVAEPLRRGGLQLIQQGGPLEVRLQHRLQQGHGRGRVFLVHRADAGPLGQTDFAVSWDELPEDQLEQRRLARAIAADQAHLGPFREPGGGVIEEPAAPRVEYEIGNLQHRRSGRLLGRKGRGYKPATFIPQIPIELNSTWPNAPFPSSSRTRPSETSPAGSMP